MANIKVLSNDKTVIIGNDLIPPKLAFLVDMMFEKEIICDINAIVFDTHTPETYGRTNLLTDTFKINLSKHLIDAFQRARDIEDEFGPVFYWLSDAWLELLDTIIHEAGHIMAQKHGIFDDSNKDEMKHFINQGLIALAQAVDIETPPIGEWGGLEGLILGKTENIQNCPERWARKQVEVMRKGVFMVYAEKSTTVKSIREYLRYHYPEHENNVGWGNPIATFGLRNEEEDRAIEAGLQYTPPPMFDQPNPRSIDYLEACYGEEGYIPRDESGYIQPGVAFASAPAAAMAPQVHHLSPAVQAATAARLSQPAAVAKPIVAPPVSLSPQEVAKAMETFYKRLSYLIFEKCGWNPANGGNGFTNPYNVYEGIFIGDIEGINQIVLSADMPGENNTIKTDIPLWESTDPQKVGRIYGVVFKNTQLPAFRYYVNYMGSKYKRSFIPQNIVGRTSKNADRARRGEQIAYVFDGEKREGGAPIGSWEHNAFRKW